MVSRPASIVADYIESVVEGSRTVGRLERLAVERYLHDIDHAAERGYRFDIPLAEHACSFFSCLRHSKGEWAGEPFELAPWEAFVTWNVFGWVRISDRLRRFRTAYIETARKNGKTTFAAGIGLYLLSADAEPGAEVYTAATKREQARLVHSEAVRMRNKSPTLKDHIESWRDNLSIPSTSSKYEPLGADVDGMDGLNVHAAIVDELHAHKTRRCWDLLETGTGARRQPLMFAITTAGVDKSDQAICWELHRQGEQVVEGFEDGSYLDDRFFAFIATLDKDDDWRDPKVWAKANPSLGISVKEDIIRDQARDAERNPGKQNAFRRLRCNQWTEQYTRWIDLAVWDHGNARFDPSELEGRVCFGGLDLASKHDIAAFLLLFPDEDRVKLLARFWVPEETMKQRVKEARVPYDVWAREGWIEVTRGNVCDYDLIERRIGEDSSTYQIREIAFDPWNATQLVTHLLDDGAKMVQVSQGFKALSPPSKEWETLVMGERLLHAGNPVMRWMMGNVALEMDANGNIRPSRKGSQEKIDGVVAGVMALSRLMVSRAEGASVYDDRGILTMDFDDDDLAAYERGELDI